jgi:hypothetical protein
MTSNMPSELDHEVSRLLRGAVDLHCHSGPAAMPRILDHHEAMLDAAAAGFRALVYKDHFYLGSAHAQILEKLFPETNLRLFSGLVLNNASGGLNPHAVDHCIKMGGKIVWLPTLSAANHLAAVASGAAATFPSTAKKMIAADPLSALDSSGQVIDPLKRILDLIAADDIILAGGHLAAAELITVFEEARRRGVTKLLVNHPTYIVRCSDDDIRALVGLGAYIEHSICMFVEGRSKKYSSADLERLIKLAGVDRTILSSDLGLVGSPRPIEGFRAIVRQLLDLRFAEADIRAMTGDHAARLLDLAPIAVETGAAGRAAVDVTGR